MSRMRIVRTRYGARVMQGNTFLSKILSRPGPLHDLYDVMAVAVARLAPGPGIALLGFAGGGLIGPLRAAGCRAPIEAVDLSRAGEPIFRRLSADWCGSVRLSSMDAVEWLRRGNRRFDMIIEDLTVNSPAGPTKPAASIDPLPRLIRGRLARRGIALINVLPVPGFPIRELLNRIAEPFPDIREIEFTEFENCLLICGANLSPAREIGRLLRKSLVEVGSRMPGRFSVRTHRKN